MSLSRVKLVRNRLFLDSNNLESVISAGVYSPWRTEHHIIFISLIIYIDLHQRHTEMKGKDQIISRKYPLLDESVWQEYKRWKWKFYPKLPNQHHQEIKTSVHFSRHQFCVIVHRFDPIPRKCWIVHREIVLINNYNLQVHS